MNPPCRRFFPCALLGQQKHRYLAVCYLPQYGVDTPHTWTDGLYKFG